MKFSILKLELALMLLQVGIDLFGLKVWMRETAYHTITRFQFRTGAALAFDKNDPDFKQAVADAVEEATSGLKSKRDELLAEVRKLKQGKEIDPAEVTRLETEVDALKAQLSDANKAVKTLTKTAEDATKALTSEQAFTQKLVVENALVAELTAAGVPAGPLLKGALAMLKAEKIEVAADGDNRVATIGGKALPEFVKAWTGGDDGKAYVAASSNSGGGAPGGKPDAGGPANPFAKETLNMTAQGQLYKTNPTQAKAMAEAAGVTL